MKTGLFFGSFNPITIGHLVIANCMATNTDLKKVWLVVSPHNPLKDKRTLLNDYDRYHLVQLAIEDNPKLVANNSEFNLPQPSYTINTLIHLTEKYPQHEFVLIMGSDNLESLHKWKNYEAILNHYSIYVYKRKEKIESNLLNHSQVKVFDFPILDISSSKVREMIKGKQSVRYLLPDNVFEYIKVMKYYMK